MTSHDALSKMLIATLVKRRNILPQFVRQIHKTHKANKLLDRCIFHFLLLCYYYCCCFTKINQHSVINGHKVRTVKDGGNSQSFIHLNVVRKLSIPITKRTGHVLMASASLTSKNLGYAYITFNLNSAVHNNVKNIGTR